MGTFACTVGLGVVSFGTPLHMGGKRNGKLDTLIDVTFFFMSTLKAGFLNLHFLASKHITFYCVTSIQTQQQDEI